MTNFSLKIDVPATAPHPLLGKAQADLRKLYDDGLPLLKLAEANDDLSEIMRIADGFKAVADTLILVGIGGSSLGAEAVCAIAKTPNNMRFMVMDNPDPATFAAMKHEINPKRTAWLMVSKSGGTLETIAQILLIIKWLEAEITDNKSEYYANHCHIITEAKDSPLTKIAKYFHIPTSAHDAELGGRWSCLSNVGLIPAATIGVDIAAFRQGTKSALHNALYGVALYGGDSLRGEKNYALESANFAVMQMSQGRAIHAIMPYADSLAFTSSWCRQLISESLGKDGVGITPLAALGTVDQHSMLQLLLGGGDDKFYTIITAQQAGLGETFDAQLAEMFGFGYLGGKTLGDVLDAFQHGTVESLRAAGRIVRTIHLPEINAYCLGELLMLIMLETIYASSLMNVNPFDQPSVEDSKIYAKNALGAS